MNQPNKIIPFADEASMAQLAYSRWEQENAESMAEYVYRRRTVDLASLVQQAIREELNENQQKLIRMRYYDNCTPTEIAQRTGLHLSTVLHTLRRAEDKLYRVLRYVVEYQHGLRETTLVPLAVREAMRVDAAKARPGQSFAERLRSCRTGEHLDTDATAQAVCIEPERYAMLEQGETQPDAGELVRLSSFFGVSVDALLKGGAA